VTNDQIAGALVQGSAVPGFEQVREAFAENFASFGEVGASCAVYVEGRLVVDLWGGIADQPAARPWDRDTTALVYSVTKGASAILVHLLAQDGLLSLDEPVARYWPEFGAEGKDRLTVRQLLAHRAGLPVLPHGLTRVDLLQGTSAADALAASAPIWPPNTAHGYHALTFGWLVGELVRRITGQSIGRVFANRIAAVLGIRFWIGTPAEQQAQVAKLVNGPIPDLSDIAAIPDAAARELVMTIVAAMTDPDAVLHRALTSNDLLPAPDADVWNDPAVLSAEIPAANGVTNARSLAHLYSACVSTVDGTRLLTAATLSDALVEQSNGPDQVLVGPSRFGTGFMLPGPGLEMLSSSSFGHTGAGGALGFGDVASGVGFGYVQNLISRGVTPDPRAARLVDALRGCL
jgi:CubicO group peptidase (beta-lactamase class C family)